MKVEIVARETIKPSSPNTPKSFNLCLMDQIAVPAYVKLFLFYQNNSSDIIEEVVAKRSRCLKSSLSQVLTRFYPFAGRIRDKMSVSIEENDGVEFVEARVDSILSHYLENPLPEMFLHFVPDVFWDLGMRPLLIIQASFFACGGLAIGFNISHKVSDAATFTLFINAWANTAFGNSDYKFESPDFSASLAFPAIKDHFLSGELFGETVESNNKIKRFVFTATKIAALQEKNIDRATRVEAVTAFLWRIGIKMSMKNTGGSMVPLVLLMPVNIRKYLQLPICGKTFGNMLEILIVPNDGCDIQFQYLIGLLRKQMKETREYYAKNIDGEQPKDRFLRIHERVNELIAQPVVKNYFTVSSWSKFPLYDADFGWGKPTWVANHNHLPYLTVLIDTRDGTCIEAWVNLPEKEMAIFSCDEELLAYAMPDPSAL